MITLKFIDESVKPSKTIGIAEVSKSEALLFFTLKEGDSFLLEDEEYFFVRRSSFQFDKLWDKYGGVTKMFELNKEFEIYVK